MTIKQITEIIEDGSSLKFVAQSYSEIASLKLKKIRNEVERNRLFLTDLALVYSILKAIAKRSLHQTQQKPKKTLSVLITSNYRFYGNINNDLIKFFIVHTSKTPTDRLVIGQTATDYFKTMHYFHHYTPLQLKKDMPTEQELKAIASYFNQYNQVIVYYSQLKSVLIQVPVAKDIYQSFPDFANTKTLQEAEQVVNQLDFILEPELDKMIQFFDSQIATLLLEQTFLESELARTGSRLIAMDQAQTNADEFIKEQKMVLNQAFRSINNNRLLETMAAIHNINNRKRKGHHGNW